MNINDDLLSRRILITGATGLIGQSLVKTAIACGMEVLAVVRNLEKATRQFGKDSSITYIKSDIVDLPIRNLNVDYVIHAAANTSSKAFVEEPVDIIEQSIQGMMRVLEFARVNKVKSLVYLSSMEVYGIQHTDEKIDESHSANLDPLNVRSCYPESKRLCENLCAAYFTQFGVPAKVIRLTQTFGPGVQYDDRRVFAEFARCAIENKDIVLHTKGDTKRVYLYTEDAVQAIFTVMHKGAAGEAYNAANEDTYCTIYEMACLVAEKCARNNIRVIIQEEDVSRFGYAPVLRMNLNTNKLQALGWRAETGLEQMFKLMIKDMSRQSDQ